MTLQEHALGTGDGRVPLLVLVDPVPAELEQLRHALDLTPEVAAETAATHLRPQLVAHAGTLVVVVKTPTLDGADVALGEVVAVASGTSAALVARGASDLVDEVVRTLLARGTSPVDAVLALLAAVTPDLDEVLVGLDESVLELEARVFTPARRDHTREIYSLKRELLELRRAVVPLTAVVARLADETPPYPLPERSRPVLASLLERLRRTADGVEHLDALVDSVLDAQLAQIGVRQNEDQRKISAWAAIALVPTVVGSVYGMNFEDMPELSWRFGYPAALLLALCACLALYAGFRRNDWL